MIILDKYRTLLNVTIQIMASIGALFGLWFASMDILFYQKLIGVLLFALCNNTLFSLMHESVHKIYSKNKLINEMMGIFSSVFFPTGFTFQRLCHLAHHCNNRTDHEMFDQYYKTDNLYLKKNTVLWDFYWFVLGNASIWMVNIFCISWLF